MKRLIKNATEQEMKDNQVDGHEFVVGPRKTNATNWDDFLAEIGTTNDKVTLKKNWQAGGIFQTLAERGGEYAITAENKLYIMTVLEHGIWRYVLQFTK